MLWNYIIDEYKCQSCEIIKNSRIILWKFGATGTNSGGLKMEENMIWTERQQGHKNGRLKFASVYELNTYFSDFKKLISLWSNVFNSSYTIVLQALRRIEHILAECPPKLSKLHIEFIIGDLLITNMPTNEHIFQSHCHIRVEYRGYSATDIQSFILTNRC